MVKILFVCHGNICRSPMAEFVMKDLVAAAGAADRFEIASAATSAEEIGNGVYPPARQELARHGIGCAGHAARRIRREDYDRYDYLIGMDRANLANMRRMWDGDPAGGIGGRSPPTGAKEDLCIPSTRRHGLDLRSFPCARFYAACIPSWGGICRRPS